MKLRFLGTGAADWKGIDARGELRRFTSTLIDDSLLIDQTANINYALESIRSVPALIYTHSHRDHFDLANQALIAPKAVYCHESWAKDAGAQPLEIGKSYEIAGFTVIPLPANHSTERENETALAYIIKKGEDTLLYSTDGAWLTNKAYHIIRKNAPLTACVFDGTVGDAYPDDYRVFEHNTLPMVRIVRDSLKKQNLMKSDVRVIVTHLARTLHPTQQELVDRERKMEDPLIVAYDGLELEV